MAMRMGTLLDMQVENNSGYDARDTCRQTCGDALRSTPG
jgi:hypothetical protein